MTEPMTPGRKWGYDDNISRDDYDKVLADARKAEAEVERLKKEALACVKERVRLANVNVAAEAALDGAVEIIKQWHGPEAWELYFDHAPEMQPIRAWRDASA